MATIEKRESDDGKVTFRAKIRMTGSRSESGTFTRITDARKWVQSIESAIRENRHFKVSEAKRHTLSELIDRYCRDVLIRKKGAKTQLQQLTWWKTNIGHLPLSDVTPPRIAECRDKLNRKITIRGTPLSPASVVRYMAALSHALNTAVKEWGWIDDSPMRRVSKPKEPRGRVRYLSDDERIRLLKSCKASKNIYIYPIVVLAISTGMRLGEIKGLTWDDVDLNRGRAILHKTKNGERRAVPITGLALEELMELGKVRRIDSNLLFPSKGSATKKTKNPIDIRYPWEKVIEEAEIEDFKFHDLRHTAASYLAMNGASLSEMAEVLGHKTLQMVKRYAHFSESHTDSVVKSMNIKRRILG